MKLMKGKIILWIFNLKIASGNKSNKNVGDNYQPGKNSDNLNKRLRWHLCYTIFLSFLFLGFGLQRVMGGAPVSTPGNALTFDGTNYVNCGNDPSVQITGNSLTLETWINPTVFTAGYWEGCIVAKDMFAGGSTGGYFLRCGGNGQLSFGFSPMNGQWVEAKSPENSLTLTRWQHLCGTYDGANLKLYINGVLVSTVPETRTILSSSKNLMIGQSADDPTRRFKGAIDEVCIYNVGLTQTQIRDRMYQSLTGSEAGLVAIYNFDAASGTTLNDSKGANTGTLVNNPTWGESYAMVVPVPQAATSLALTGFTANWTAPAIGTVTSYKLDVSTVSTFASFVGVYNNFDCGTNLSQAITGLSANTTYYYRVRADKTSVTGTGANHYNYITTTTMFAQPGNALAFNGTNNYVSMPNTLTNAIKTQTAITIEYWFKGTNIQSAVRFQTTGGYISSAWNGPAPKHIISTDGGTNGVSAGDPAILYDGHWHHVAMVWKQNTTNGFQSYLDGNLVEQRNSLNVSLPALTSDPGYLGALGISSGQYEFTNGSLDEVRIWNTARTQTELRSAMYNVLSPASESNLVAYYQMNVGSGTTLTDAKSGNYNGTLSTPSPAWVESYAMVVPVPQAATSLASTSFTSNWTAPAIGPLTSYKLDVSTVSTFATFVGAYNNFDCGNNLSQAVTGLSANTTYYYRIRADKTSMTGTGANHYNYTTTVTLKTNTWTGATSTNWNTSSNWSLASVPVNTEDVSIPSASITNFPTVLSGNSATCNNLLIQPGAKVTIAPTGNMGVVGNITNSNGIIGLVIQSDATGSGSLINGSAGVSATVERYMLGDFWHLISPAATAGETVISFVGATQNGNLIARNATNYALSPWLEGSGVWDYYKVSGSNTSGLFGSPSKGFQVLRTTGAGTGKGTGGGDGKLTFKGTLAATDQSIAVTKSLYGWNLIGNPYPCALDVAKFITANTALLDPSYQFIYVSKIADVTAYGYDPNTTGLKLASGEGFFVKVKAGGGSVKFTAAMKSSVSDAFKAATLDSPTIQLTVEDGNGKLATTVKYEGGATTGLDPGKDAGLFNGIVSSFSLFTRLIEDNGVDFTVQALPDNNYEKMVVPVGLVAAKGATVTFKATATNLPAGYKVYLEDKETGTFTRLDEANSTYTVTLDAATNGTGRFYLHTTEIVSAIENEVVSGIKVIPIPEQHLVRIVGNFDLPAKAMVYGMNGKLVATSKLSSQIENDIPLTNCSTGVYLLKIESGKASETRKFVWKRK